MSTRSMAARRRRAADRRKKRDTPAPRPAKLIPGAPVPSPAATSGAAGKPEDTSQEHVPASVGMRSPAAPLELTDTTAGSDHPRSIWRLRLPPLAAFGAGTAAPGAPERPPAASERAVAVRRYRDSGGASVPPSQPPRLPRPPRRPRERDGFSWRERDWRSAFWLRPLRTVPTVVVSLALLAVVLGGTFLLVTRAVGHSTLRLSSPFTSSGTPTVRTQPVIVQPGAHDTTPTPALPQYTIGVWAADPSPPGSGSDQIFVRVSNNVLPAKGIVVTLSIQLPGGYQNSGPLRTDAHGLVSYKLVYRGLPANQPIVVTATATTPAGIISATTYIVPVG